MMNADARKSWKADQAREPNLRIVSAKKPSAREEEWKPIRKLHLRAIVSCSFRNTEMTNYLEWRKKNHAFAAELKPDDCVMLRSLSGDQIVFVYGFYAVAKLSGARALALRSERVRLNKGHWDEHAIADYAERVGVKLYGLKRVNDYYGYLREGDYVSPTLAYRALDKWASQLEV